MAMASPIPAPTPVTMAGLSCNRMWIYLFLLDRDRAQFAAADTPVDHAVIHGLFGAHDVVAIHIARYAVDGLAGAAGEQTVECLAHAQNLARIDVDLGGL